MTDRFAALGALLKQRDEGIWQEGTVRGVWGRILPEARKRWPTIRSLRNDFRRQGTVVEVEAPVFRDWGDGLDFDAFPFFSWPQMPPYLTSVVVAAGEAGSTNLSIHRAMYLDPSRIALRVVPRHLGAFLQKERHARAVLFFHHDPAVLLAASWPLPSFGGELEVASSLLGGRLEVFSVDGTWVPSSSSLVICGRFDGTYVREGPFVDATGTLDPARQSPVFVAERWWASSDGPSIPVIVPAGPEHHYLMGTPRALAIWEAASMVCEVEDVHLTEGGAGWLHAVMVVRQARAGQAVAAGMAAFGAHPSLKRVVLVDPDIDPRNPTEVEWAMATRVRPDRDIHVVRGVVGSTLDPSAPDGVGAKWICDATIPHGEEPGRFRRA